MPSSIEELSVLQRVDLQLITIRRELDGLGNAASELRNELTMKRAFVEAKRLEMAEIERQRRDLEAKIADEEAKTKDRRMRMQRIRNEKELGALRREVELAKESSALFEEQLVKLIEGSEGREMEIAALEEELATREAELAAREREQVERTEALRADVERLTAEREVAAGAIDEDVLRRYQRLLERKGGLAVVEVRASGECRGCHMRVPPQLITQIHRNQDLVACPSCQRLLTREPRPPAAATK